MLFYQTLKQKALKCLACSHQCIIRPGDSGICGVRQNQAGRLKLLVYGRPCSLAVDPIEKKPLYHFLPGTKIFSLGTFGCNFKCKFCQNWDISQIAKNRKITDSLFENLKYWPSADIIKETKDRGLPAIAYTYNEPTIWTEYAIDIAKLAKKQGLKNVYVSNGYMSRQTCDYVSQYIDAINIDLKSFSENFYLKTCQARLQPVLDNIVYLHQLGLWLEITTLVIPGANDSKQELKKIADFLVNVSPDMPWHLSAFHPNYQMLDKPSTSYTKLLEAKQIGQQAGLKYIYIGNLPAQEHNNTYCPKCGELLIERQYMDAIIKGLTKGRCHECQEKIAGVFK